MNINKSYLGHIEILKTELHMLKYIKEKLTNRNKEKLDRTQ